MKLKGRVAHLENVPEHIRIFYVPDSGGYLLDVEGMVPKERLDSFRQNNIELRRQIEILARDRGSEYHMNGG